jgi:hypothetical protein
MRLQYSDLQEEAYCWIYRVLFRTASQMLHISVKYIGCILYEIVIWNFYKDDIEIRETKKEAEYSVLNKKTEVLLRLCKNFAIFFL